MARVIRMQGYKDWKDGLITTEEMLKGNVFREPQQTREMWLRIIARATGNWEGVPHHDLCCCKTCAPTEDVRRRKVQLHELELSAFVESQNVGLVETMSEVDHDPLCWCEICIDELFEPIENENLAPSDCEE